MSNDVRAPGHPSSTPLDTTRRRLLAAALAASLATRWGLVSAQAGNKITIAYPTRSGAAWPMYLAKDGGYYEKHGLSVNLVFGVHPAGIAMLTSNQAHMTNYGIDPAMIASSRDGSLVAMGSSLNKGSFALISGPKFKKVEELKGGKIGVGRVGDTPYHYTVSMLKRHGLGPRDVQWLPTGADAAGRVATLMAGQIDAALLTSPGYFRLVDSGKFRHLAFIGDYDDIFVSTVYLFRKATVSANPQLPELIIKAQAEGIKRFYEDKVFAIKSFASQNPREEPVDTARVYDQYVKSQALDRIPLVLKGAVQSAIDNHAESNPELKTYDFRQIVDNSVVLKLIREGWFEKLYGAAVKTEQSRKMQAAFGA